MVARILVLEKLDGYVAERHGGEIARRMGEASGDKVGFAVPEFEANRRLAFNFIRDFRVTQRDEHVVVAMTVDKCDFAGSDFDFENPDVVVLEKEVVVGLDGDLDFGRSLGGSENGREEGQRPHAFRTRREKGWVTHPRACRVSSPSRRAGDSFEAGGDAWRTQGPSTAFGWRLNFAQNDYVEKEA
jgi:hypothetical protein